MNNDKTSSRINNFFTSERREVRQGPLKAEIHLNAVENLGLFLSPHVARMSLSKKVPKNNKNQEKTTGSLSHKS